VVVVSAPVLGDGIQAMKAGLLEIADILVVNKADRDGADRTAEELAAGLALRVSAGNVPVMKTSAIAGTGVRELWCSIAGKGKVRMAAGIETRRRRRARYLIARAAEDVIAARMRDGDAATDALVDAILAGEVVPLEAAVRLLSENVGR
jgi:LAO/AO transport system kinase